MKRNVFCVFKFTAVFSLTCLLMSCGGGPSTNADLSNLTVSFASLSPAFDPEETSYTANVKFLVSQVEVTPTTEDAGASVTVNGTAVVAGGSADVPVKNLAGFSYGKADGDPTTISVVVTAADGTTTKTYTVSVTRALISTFDQQAYLKASNTGDNDRFGCDIGISGDTIVVGACNEESSATTVDGDQTDNSAQYSGAAYVFTRSDTTWTQEAYLKAFNAEADDSFGNAVAVSGNTIAVSADYEDSSATGVDGDETDNGAADSGAVYIFVRDNDTWTQEAYLKASNTEYDDDFGISLDLDGDTLVVGASYEDSDATGVNGDESNNDAEDSGAVYVFVRNGTTWTQEAYLKAFNTEDSDAFGKSVAISKDTIVVGAPGEDSQATTIDGDETDNSASLAGAAYVFVRNDSTWTQEAYLKASNAELGDIFGASVDISGDTIVVGASDEESNATGVDGDDTDNSASNAGAAYIFKRSGSTWTQEAYLKASNTEQDDYFGAAVTIAGGTVAVNSSEASNATGINGDETDNSEINAGAVYVFVREDGVWSPKAYVKPSNSESQDYFGYYLDLAGDTLVVGALNEDSKATGINGDDTDNSSSSSGAAYVFQ